MPNERAIKKKKRPNTWEDRITEAKRSHKRKKMQWQTRLGFEEP